MNKKTAPSVALSLEQFAFSLDIKYETENAASSLLNFRLQLASGPFKPGAQIEPNLQLVDQVSRLKMR